MLEIFIFHKTISKLLEEMSLVLLDGNYFYVGYVLDDKMQNHKLQKYHKLLPPALESCIEQCSIGSQLLKRTFKQALLIESVRNFPNNRVQILFLAINSVESSCGTVSYANLCEQHAFVPIIICIVYVCTLLLKLSNLILRGLQCNLILRGPSIQLVGERT